MYWNCADCWDLSFESKDGINMETHWCKLQLAWPGEAFHVPVRVKPLLRFSVCIGEHVLTHSGSTLKPLCSNSTYTLLFCYMHIFIERGKQQKIDFQSPSYSPHWSEQNISTVTKRADLIGLKSSVMSVNIKISGRPQITLVLYKQDLIYLSYQFIPAAVWDR